MKNNNTLNLCVPLGPKRKAVPPPDEELMRKLRKRRMRERNMWLFIGDIFAISLFVIAIVSIAFATREPESYIIRRLLYGDVIGNAFKGATRGVGGDVSVSYSYWHCLNTLFLS